MYYQVYFRNANFKQVQVSCDSWEEVIEVIEKRDPKFIDVHYFNSDGLVGIARKYKVFVTGLWKTWKKIKAN